MAVSGKSDHWMQGAVKHPGALTAAAKRAGAYHNGRIDSGWLNAQAKKGGTIGRRARLAKVFRKSH